MSDSYESVNMALSFSTVAVQQRAGTIVFVHSSVVSELQNCQLMVILELWKCQDSFIASAILINNLSVIHAHYLSCVMVRNNSTQLNSTGDYGRRCKHPYFRIIMYIFFKKKHY